MTFLDGEPLKAGLLLRGSDRVGLVVGELSSFCLLFLAVNHSKAGNKLGLGVGLVLGLGIRSGIVLGIRLGLGLGLVLGLGVF